MSRIIKLTPEMIQAAQAEFGEQLAKCTPADGKFQYTKTFEEKGEKAVLYYTQLAWIKMTALIEAFNCKEVAWHGVARRVDGEDNAYVVSDIVVYPQTVGSATVEMDEASYAKWLIANDGDERFDSLRFQGHSHVDMGVSPSGTDIDHQNKILALLGPDDFYIFAIYNKSLSRAIRIYDLRQNRMFDTADVTVKIIWDFDFDGFMAESKSMVQEKTYPSYSGHTGYSGGGGYTGYQGSENRPVTPGGTSKALATVEKPAKNKPATKPGVGNWNIPGQAGFDDDDTPYPAQK